jgi:hypothetical protein
MKKNYSLNFSIDPTKQEVGDSVGYSSQEEFGKDLRAFWKRATNKNESIMEILDSLSEYVVDPDKFLAVLLCSSLMEAREEARVTMKGEYNDLRN